MVRYYMLVNDPAQALTIAGSALELAKNNGDNEYFVKINNILAQYYLDINNPKKALSLLQESEQYQPVAMPYLMLKSKTYFQLNQLNKAIELAHTSKRKAYDLWSTDDEAFLAKLVSQK